MRDESDMSRGLGVSGVGEAMIVVDVDDGKESISSRLNDDDVEREGDGGAGSNLSEIEEEEEGGEEEVCCCCC